MIAVVALRHAGPDAVLAARPTGVPHVYTGPLSRSGRGLPRTSRPLCRARTLRLTVLTRGDCDTTRVCARCAVCLISTRTAPRTRDDYKTTFTGLTGDQLAAALDDARTSTEVDHAAHLTLLLYGVTGCRTPNPSTGRSLTAHVHHARTRTGDGQLVLDAPAWADHLDHVNRQRRTDLWEAREQRIARVGFVNATAPKK